MNITTIVFDLGNVVLTNDHPYHTPEELAEFIQYFGVTMDNLSTAWDPTFSDFKLGKVTEDIFWKNFLELARAKNIDATYVKAFWRKHQKENEHLLSLLNKLKQNYQLAALTTIGREALDFKKVRFHLEKYFPVIVSSGYTGLAKPNIEFYKLLLGELTAKPEEILYIDDTPDCLLPAEKLGMRTILFRGQEDLEKQLQALGISYG